MTMTSVKQAEMIIKIVAAGGGVIIDASKYPTQLEKIAAAAQVSGATVIIQNIEKTKPSGDQLVKIAKAGARHVIFDLTT